MKAKGKKISNELRPEYDFDYSKAVRGKYYKRLITEGANVVMLETDVAKSGSSWKRVGKICIFISLEAYTSEFLSEDIVRLVSHKPASV